MKTDVVCETLALVSSQLEAASTLLKYAADDLAELLASRDVPLAEDVQLIAQNLQTNAAAVAGTGAFFVRLAEERAASPDEPQAGLGKR